MKKWKSLILACFITFSLIISFCGIKKTEVFAEDGVYSVTFDYNSSRIVKYIQTNDDINKSLENYTIEVEDGHYIDSIRYPNANVTMYYKLKWTVDGVIVNPLSLPIEKDTTFVALWIPENFTLRYLFESEEVKSQIKNIQPDITFNVESPRIDFYRPQRDHYSFVGWYSESDPTLEQLYISAGSCGSYDITARFVPIEYSINYNTDAKIYNNPKSYNVEDTDIVLYAPSKEGHIFKGWFKDEACTEEITTIDCSVGGSINLYPLWDLEEYKVIYVLPDGKVEVVKTEYGKKAELPSGLKKNIFQIVKSDVSRKNITGDVTIKLELVNIWYVYLIGLMMIAGIVALLIVKRKNKIEKHNKLRTIYQLKSRKK